MESEITLATEYPEKGHGIQMARVDLSEYNNKIRAEAIDNYMNKLCNHCMLQINECHRKECPFNTDGCEVIKIAGQLKEQK